MSVHDVQTWLRAAVDRPIVVRSLGVAAVVGTLLALINYSDRLVAGRMLDGDWLKLVLTYAVPYGVSTYSGVCGTRERQPPAVRAGPDD